MCVCTQVWIFLGSSELREPQTAGANTRTRRGKHARCLKKKARYFTQFLTHKSTLLSILWTDGPPCTNRGTSASVLSQASHQKRTENWLNMLNITSVTHALKTVTSALVCYRNEVSSEWHFRVKQNQSKVKTWIMPQPSLWKYENTDLGPNETWLFAL